MGLHPSWVPYVDRTYAEPSPSHAKEPFGFHRELSTVGRKNIVVGHAEVDWTEIFERDTGVRNNRAGHTRRAHRPVNLRGPPGETEQSRRINPPRIRARQIHKALTEGFFNVPQGWQTGEVTIGLINTAGKI